MTIEQLMGCASGMPAFIVPQAAQQVLGGLTHQPEMLWLEDLTPTARSAAAEGRRALVVDALLQEAQPFGAMQDRFEAAREGMVINPGKRPRQVGEKIFVTQYQHLWGVQPAQEGLE